MALYKEVRQSDGVTTSYHRILYVMKTVNRQNSIAVMSYVDDAARSDEQSSVVTQPYSKSVTYETDYNDGMTVADAYEWLKTLPVFEGAEDI